MESNSLPSVFFITCFLIFLQNPCQAQVTGLITSPVYYCPTTSANYTSGSEFGSNLVNLLLPSLFSNGPRNGGFFNTSFGNNTDDAVYGLVQCRGDISMEACRNCLNTSRFAIIERCPNRVVAGLRYEHCLLRYSNVNFFTQVDSSALFIRTTDNVSEPNRNTILGSLMDNLTSNAASKPTKFETGSTRLNNFGDLYGLVQCTQDLSRDNCLRCLRSMVSLIPSCCIDSSKGMVVSQSCLIDFQNEIFFEPQSPPPAPPPPSDPGTGDDNGGGKGSSSNFVVIGVPTVIGVLLLLGVCVFLLMRKRRKNTPKLGRYGSAGIDVDEIQSAESLQFNLSTIRVATDNFSEANKLGQGGFGSVYKGILPEGEEIAVKRLSTNSGQGREEFKNEVLLLLKLQHRNLVRLFGYCLDTEEKLLIYEFVPNASLDQFIFDPTRRATLDWERRYKIIEGIARGLLYLHEDSRHRIIHRDLKTSNILLSADMNPKIADFGMARLFAVDQTQGSTSRVVGTYGYMAPEYAMHGQFSIKSDVFSFGVLVLEIISGKKNNSFYESERGEDLLSHTWRNWKEGTTLDLLDETFRESCSRSEVMRCIHIGLLCVQDDMADRPTMASVCLMLNSYSITLALPSPPAFFLESRKQASIMSGESETMAIMSDKSSTPAWTVNDVSITELYPR